jgi:hypothetical protein
MSRRSFDFNFKCSRLENFLMPGAGRKGRGATISG